MAQKDRGLPNDTVSYWKDSVELPDFPALEEDIDVNVCIVGGGITGVISAYLLAQEGLKVTLLEADQLLGGTTGHTTAKLTAQHGLIYDELITNLGKSKAKLYYEANKQALQFINKTINDLDIDCDFKNEDAYLYATTDEYAEKIEAEAKAYDKLGIDGERTDTFPINIDIKNAVIMKNQAQFHPLKFLSKLVDEMIEMGVEIYGKTVAVNVEEGAYATVLTREGHRITADHVLICSHFPFYEGLGFYSTRLYAERSYVLAGKPKKDYPGGMFISADDPTRSIRSVTINEEEMVLVIGENHKTGQGKDTTEHYKALKDFGEQVFAWEDISYRWSAQDVTTLDKVPYVGEITPNQPNILIATGYRKWGMTNGTAAALLMADIVTEKKNPFQSLYTPSRFHANPSIKTFLTQNLNVAGQLIKGKLDTSKVDPRKLNNDEAAIIRIDGERKGAYRDTSGELHIVDTTCTHIGCEVAWNGGDRSWDCPCHGSRFNYNGDVLEGPAEKPLQKYDYKMHDNLTSDDSGY